MFGKNYVQRIIIVEDDELIRKELSRFLTYEGYEAVCIEKFENDFQTAESILQDAGSGAFGCVASGMRRTFYL